MPRPRSLDESANTRGVAEALFDAIERGDPLAAAACYADHAVIWRNTDGLETTKAENVGVLEAFIRNVPSRRYDDRRLRVFPGGFVQQHVLRAVLANGTLCELPACLVCRVDGGLITRLDEYFDAVQVEPFRG